MEVPDPVWYYMNFQIIVYILFNTEYDLQKLVILSAHDSTCGAFMGFMKSLFGTPIKYPLFDKNINLELVREGDAKKEDNYYVKYIINDDDITEIK